MPQGRFLRKSISESRKLSLLKTDGARLLFTWLIPHLDVQGCFSGDPEVVGNKIFTRLGKPKKQISEYLEDLQAAGLIVLYESEGDTFLYVPTFVQKQAVLRPEHEAKPTIPMPTDEQMNGVKVAVPEKPPAKEPKPKIGFDGNYWTGITEEDTRVWKETYPACDIAQELREMVGWLLADWPARRKTKWRAFIQGWLSRNQNRGGTKGMARSQGGAKERMLASLGGEK